MRVRGEAREKVKEGYNDKIVDIGGEKCREEGERINGVVRSWT